MYKFFPIFSPIWPIFSRFLWEYVFESKLTLVWGVPQCNFEDVRRRSSRERMLRINRFLFVATTITCLVGQNFCENSSNRRIRSSRCASIPRQVTLKTGFPIVFTNQSLYCNRPLTVEFFHHICRPARDSMVFEIKILNSLHDFEKRSHPITPTGHGFCTELSKRT